MNTVEKVVAYITQGKRLLIFSHPQYPEAGIQVPGGTLEAGESPLEAALREAREETGLEDFQVRRFLGIQDFDLSPLGRPEIHRRYVYHLEYPGPTPAIWRHYEMDPSDGSPAPIELEFYWVDFPEAVPELSGGLGALLHKLAEDSKSA